MDQQAVTGEVAPIVDALSRARLEGYLEEVNGDWERALELYEWNSRMASACFVQIGYLEVLLRNALDRALAEYAREAERGIPWFLQVGVDLPSGAREHIKEARERLWRDDRPDSRDRVIASLSFGFWSRLLGTRHDEL